MKQGNKDAFITILTEGAQPDLESYYDAQSRIGIINALAAYYASLGMHSSGKEREHLFEQATGHYNAADRIDIHQLSTWVGKGLLLFAKGDWDRALYHFNTVLEGAANNIAAMLGKACILYNRGHYEEALSLYRAVLQTHPQPYGSTVTVRLGIGLCLWRLGRSDVARKAFQRVLQLEPQNGEALVGLAVLMLNTGEEQQVKQAMLLLKQALEQHPTNSRVLNLVADHFFWKQDYGKVRSLASTAYSHTEVAHIKAESCYQIARAHHAQDQYAEAFQYYLQAVRHWPELVLAQYGLGQMYVWKGETEKAIGCFELVIAAQPDNYETLRVLGALYAQSQSQSQSSSAAAADKRLRAIGHLNRAVQLQPGDVEVWLDLAQLLQLANNAPPALHAYETALKLLTSASPSAEVPAQLWNNIAVLRHSTGNLQGAADAYQKALQRTSASETEFKASK